MFGTEARIIVEQHDDEEKTEDFFAHYAAMADLIDKLKLLNYEKEFLVKLKMKPIHRFYFVTVRNPGEQFYLFSCLAAWLLRKSGRTIDQPQESDDPNDTITKIIEIAKSDGVVVDYPQNKLKQGVGEHVVSLLNKLADIVLRKSNLVWKRPIFQEEENEEEIEIIEDESEITLEKVEEEMIAAYSDDSDDGDIFRIGSATVKTDEDDLNKLATNEESWLLEVERVAPLLKVTVRNDNRDWRSHADQMKQYKLAIDKTAPEAKKRLEKLRQEIALTTDKIGQREKYLNRELDEVLDGYRRKLDELSRVKEELAKISGGVAERDRTLNKLNDRLETIKKQMEERGSSMTDGTPLVNIKKSINALKNEIANMDVRIGVLDCVLLQTKIADERQMENEIIQ